MFNCVFSLCNRSSLRHFLLLGFLFSIAALDASAKGCWLQSSTGGLFTVTRFISPLAFTVEESASIGSVIYSGTASALGGVQKVNCYDNRPFAGALDGSVIGPPNFYYTAGWGGIPMVNIPLDGIFDSGISGVGVKYQIGGIPFPNRTANYPNISNAGMIDLSRQLTFQYIKIGKISSGSSLGGATMVYITSGTDYSNVGSPWNDAFWFFGGVTITQLAHTCRVNPIVSVVLGTINKSSFSNVGSTSPEMPFNLQLNCSGGSASNVTKVSVTFTDALNVGNTTSNLSLSKDSSASGLAVQFINKTTGSLVKFGPDSNSLGNTNQIFLGNLVGTAGNGMTNYPFTARYIRTGAVVGGSANSSATFTMSYN